MSWPWTLNKKRFERVLNTHECIGTNTAHRARLSSWRKNYSFLQQYFAIFRVDNFLVFWVHCFLCSSWNFKSKETKKKILVVFNKNCWLDAGKLFPVTLLGEIGKSYLLTLLPTQTLKKTLVGPCREHHSGEVSDNFAQLAWLSVFNGKLTAMWISWKTRGLCNKLEYTRIQFFTIILLCESVSWK